MSELSNDKLLKKEWNFEKNEGLDINDFTLGSNKKVWWRCQKCESEWKATICNRTNGRKCPFCSGKRVNHTNSIASLRPDLLKYWDYTKNEKTPNDFTLKSGKKIWAICDKQHSYETDVRNFTSNLKCPYCIGKFVCIDNCLATINPLVASEWNYERNSGLTPFQVTSGSNKKVWWKCKKCKSEWDAKVNSRNANGTGCPYCTSQKVNHTNSFSSFFPELISFWDYEKNKKTPNEYIYKSPKEVWWICKEGHSYKASISKMVKSKNCPICTSFAYNFPNLVKEWCTSRNGNLTPYDVTCGSGRKVWWRCDKNHEWLTPVTHRSRGHNCPYCMGKKADSENNLEVINPNLALEWCYNLNDSEPKDYLPYSNKKVWWECKECSSKWKSSISDRSSGRGCSFCSQPRGEKAIRQWLLNENIEFEQQKMFVNLLGLGGGNLSYDFFIPHYDLLIEYQGEFHDGSGREYTRLNLEKQQEHDRRKRDYAEKNNFGLLEIWYWDYENIDEMLKCEMQSFESIKLYR